MEMAGGNPGQSQMKLHAYQQRGVDHILSNPYCALFWDLGLGKTLTTLVGTTTLMGRGDLKRCLIVAPKRVALHTWPTEISKWFGDQYRVSLITGTPSKRMSAAKADADFYLINFENLAWLVGEFLKDWRWDGLVIDESSKCKSPSTKRFKAIKKILKHVDTTILLSGTPAPNSLLDLWSQVYLLDMGERLLPSMTRYKAKYFKSDYMGYSWTPKEGAREVIQNKISDLCMSLKAEDYLDMPDYIENCIPVYLSETEQATYKELEDEFFLELSGSEIVAANAAVLASKCLQYANGALYDTESDWHEVHAHKLDALEDIIEESAGAPILVAYNYQFDLERLRYRFPQAQVLDKQGTLIDKWNEGKVPVLLVHPASAGHGLNLQQGGNIIVWFGLTWSLENYLQLNGRLYRQGQTKPVFVHHIITEGTVDELVLERLRSKASVQDILMNALKGRV